RLLEQIQAEVHRFAITFHRDKRSKSQLSSRLDYIKGIGPKTKDELLRHFHSVQAISTATLEELAEAIGPAKGRIVYEHFHNEQPSTEG
ncbi:helix-hairpin-helix domain-containing protein, partial [uncultured Porphyromonas sp.]|uniref:helix-hairpin-helix domain-containing protein n=1 Tax=uncultured Porphyromonas sp. TaxID=159274 RepID=UPI00260D0B73